MTSIRLSASSALVAPDHTWSSSTRPGSAPTTSVWGTISTPSSTSRWYWRCSSSVNLMYGATLSKWVT